MKKLTLLIFLLNLLQYITPTPASAKNPSCTLTATASNPAPILCNGGTTAVTVSATGGSEPYAGVGTFTVSAGVYSYIVTDAAGCSATTSITISQPEQLVVSECGCSHAKCKGDTVHKGLTITGGTPPYTGAGPYVLTAGTYFLTVTDVNGCSSTISVTITEPDTLIPSVTAGTIACHGGSAIVDISATGGTIPYSGTGEYVLPEGSYNYTIYDSLGCSANVHVDLTAPPYLSATATPGATSCITGTAVVTVTATGGTAPYSGIGTFNESPGVHTYNITDANGCTTSTTIYIDGPTSITANALSGNIKCHGGATTINVSGSGGTAPYTGIGNFTVSAGTYSYTVTDAAGCLASTSVTVNEPAVLTASSSIAASCGGTAEVTINATGGTAPYSGIGTFTVSPGSYIFTVSDVSGCIATAPTTINPSPGIVANAIAEPIKCYGASTTVTVSATSGIPPFTGIGTFTVTAGTYNYTVTDAKGCTGIASVTITQPTELIANATASPIVCNGGTTTISLTGSGGVGPYSGIGYHAVHAGNYSYTITDTKGCNASTSINLPEPPLLVATASADPIQCFGAAASVSVSATGGALPYSGIGSYSVTAGPHFYTVTDARGCSSTTSITLTEPDGLHAYAASSSAGCGENANNGKAWVAISGGTTPYRCQWNAAAGNAISDTASDLRPGTYFVTITDKNNCSLSTPVTVSGGNAAVTVEAVTSPPPCFNDNKGSIDLNISGGSPPYQCKWSCGANTPHLTNIPSGIYNVSITDKAGCTNSISIDISQPAPIFTEAVSPLYPGGYNVSAYHASDGSIVCSVKGGTQPYTFTWSNGSTSENLQNLSAGEYSLLVTDTNGCTAKTNVELKEPIPIDLPEGISPNGDGINDQYIIRGIDNYPDNELQIFNRWGNLVYSTEKYKNTWDGVNKNGEPLPDGTYYVVLKLNKEITKAAYIEVRR